MQELAAVRLRHACAENLDENAEHMERSLRAELGSAELRFSERIGLRNQEMAQLREHFEAQAVNWEKAQAQWRQSQQRTQEVAAEISNRDQAEDALVEAQHAAFGRDEVTIALNGQSDGRQGFRPEMLNQLDGAKAASGYHQK